MPASKTITWNGIPSTDVPGLVVSEILRDPIGAVRTAMVEVPGRDGAWIFPQNRGMRVMSVECFIERDTTLELRESTALFTSWLDVLGQAYLQTSDDPGVYWEAMLASVTEQTAWRGVGQYSIDWRLQPYALDEGIEVEAWISDANDIHTWDPGVDMEVFPIVQIKPTNGTLTGFTLTTNDEQLTFTGNILSGSTVSINSIALVVVSGISTDTELTGAYNPALNLMQYMDGEFPTLQPIGNNEMHFVVTGGTATAIDISVSYRKKYRK